MELFFTLVQADGGWAIYPPAIKQLGHIFLVSKEQNKGFWGFPVLPSTLDFGALV